jgi:hypothetical protein
MKSGLSALLGAITQCHLIDGNGNKKGEAKLTSRELTKANRDLVEQEVEHRWVATTPHTPSQYDLEQEAANSYIYEGY